MVGNLPTVALAKFALAKFPSSSLSLTAGHLLSVNATLKWSRSLQILELLLSRAYLLHVGSGSPAPTNIGNRHNSLRTELDQLD